MKFYWGGFSVNRLGRTGGLLLCALLFHVTEASASDPFAPFTQSAAPAAPVASAVVTFDEMLRRDQILKSLGGMPESEPPPRMPSPLAIPSDDRITEAPESQVPKLGVVKSTPALSASFQGLPDGGSRPPDTNGAVGPNHLLVALNDRVRIQTKTGSTVSTVSQGAFWSSLGFSDVFDPKSIYDPHSGRFIMVICAQRRSSNSHVLLAVSSSSNPTDSWHLYAFKADPASVQWADYNNLGVTNELITFTTNLFTISSDGFQGVQIWAVEKSSVLGGGAAQAGVFRITNSGGTISPCLTYSASESTQYLVNVFTNSSGGKGYLRLYTVTGPAGARVFSATSKFPNSTPWSTFFLGAPQAGGTTTVQTNDQRMMNAVLRNGRIWCTHNVALPASGANRVAVKWWEIDPGPGTTVQSGVVDDGSSFYYYPAIAVNKDNEVLLGFSGSTPSNFIRAYYVYRDPGIAAGTMSPVTLIKEGESHYNRGSNRWGDYSYSGVDPVDDKTLWTLQMYAGPSNSWGNWWGKLSTGGDAPTVTIGPPSATRTNSGPVTYTVTYTNADSVALTAADVSLNATGSAAGTVSVSGSGTSSRTVTVSSISGNGSLGISIAPGTSSQAGEPDTGAGPSATFTVDNTPPTAAITLLDPNPTNLNTVRFGVAFSESVAGTFSAADVSVTGSLASGASVSTAGTDPNYTVSVTPSNPNADGALGITIGTNVFDLAGNSFGGASSPSSYTIDNTPPAISIGAPSASLTRNGPVSFTVTYTGANSVSLAAGNVTLNTTGSATGSISVSGTGTSTRTLTVSNISGNGTLGISIAAGTASDTAGNTAPAAGPSATFAVDNTPPSVSIGPPSVTVTNTGPVTFAVSYSGADTVSLNASHVTLNPTGTASGSVSVSGTGTSTRTVTISSISGNGSLGISIAAGTASDAAGNTAPAVGPSATFTVDNTGPAVSIGAPSTGVTNSGPVSYTVTYSGADSISLSAGNVTLETTGSATGSVSVSGSGTSSRTVTVSSTAGNGTIAIRIAAGTASDALGNLASAAGPSAAFTVDNQAPSVSIGPPSTSLTNTGPVSFTVTYTGADSVSLAAGDVTLNATGSATATVGVSGSGASSRTVTLSSITGNGTLGISLAAGTASDAAGNTAPSAGPSATFTVDNSGPAVSIGGPSASLTNTGPVSFTVTYTGADSVSLGPGDVTLNATGSATATVGVSGSGASSRTVTLSSITGNGTLGISLAAGTALDTLGNAAPSAGPSATFTVDNAPPSVSIGSPSASLTNTGPVSFIVTYTGADSVSLAAGNVTLNSTGSASATVGVSGSGVSSRTVTLSSITGNGTLGISIGAGTASDTAGNAAPAAGPSATFTVDNTPPSVSISSPSAAVTNTGPVSFTVTYTGASTINLGSGNIGLNVSGSAAASTVQVSGSGTSSRTVTLSGISGNGAIGISVAAGTAADAAGNTAPSAGPSATFTVDNTPPTVSLSGPSGSLTNTGPVTYTVTYSGADTVTLAPAHVTLNRTGSATGNVGVSGSGASSRTITISSISGNGAIGVSLSAGTASDQAGNLASGAGPSTTFSVDNTAPSAVITLLDPNPTNLNAVRFGVNFSESVGSTFTAADVSPTGTLASGAGVSVSGSGSSYTVTLTPSNPDADGTLGITIGTGVTDAAGNSFAGASSPSSYTIDNTPPGIAIGAPSVSTTATGPVTFTITYTGATAIALDASDVTLNTSGSAAGTAAVSGSGLSQRTVSISSISGAGTLGISIASDTATDAAGNSAAAAGPSATVTIDPGSVSVSISAPSVSETRAGPVSYSVTYGNVDAITLSSSDVILNATGSATASTVNVSGAGLSERTITLSDISGNGALGISLPANTASNAGNPAPTAGPSATFVVDNDPPVATIGAPSQDRTNTGPISYTVTYAGANTITLDASAVGVITTGAVTVGDVSVTGTGAAARTVTLDGIAGDGTASIALQAGTAEDSVGNAAPAAGPGASFIVDNTAPTATIILPDSNPTNADSVQFDISFSESVAGFLASDITVTGSLASGAAVNLSGSGAAYSVEITPSDPDADGTLGIEIGPGVNDLAGNPFTGAAAPDEYVIDNTPPGVVIAPLDPMLTNLNSVRFSATFDEQVGASFSAADVTVTGSLAAGAGINVTGADPAYTVTITPSSPNADGSIGINIGDQVFDLAGNQFGGASSPQSYTIDNTPPGASITRLDSSPTSLNSVRFGVEFDEPVTLASGSPHIVLTGTLAGAAALNVTGPLEDAMVTVTPNDPNANGTVGISVTSVVTDIAGNPFPGADSALYTIDNLAPLLSIGAPSSALTRTGPVEFPITYTNAEEVTLSAPDVQLETSGSVTGTINVTGTGVSSRTVVVTGIEGDGSLRISIGPETASRATGAHAPGAGPSAEVTVDNTRPEVAISAPDQPLAANGPVSFAVAYTGASNITLSNADVIVEATGTAAVGAIDVSGTGASARTVTLSGLSGDGTLSISLEPGTAVDAAGNTALGAGPSPAVAVDNTPPSAEITLASPNPSNAEAFVFEVEFSESVGETFDASDIAVTGSLAAGASVEVSGDGPAYSVTVTVADPGANGDLGIEIGTNVFDPAGNQFAGAASPETYQVDNTPPSVAISGPSATPVSTGPVSYTVSYSGAQSVTLGAADVTLNAIGTASAQVAVSGSGQAERVITLFNIAGNGSLSIAISPGTAVDAAGNTAPGAGPSAMVEVDNTPPGVFISPPSASVAAGGPVTYTITYAEAAQITLGASDVSLNASGTAAGSVAVSGTGLAQRVVTVSGITGDGALSISLAAGSARDAVGNPAPGVGPSASFTVDNTPPQITVSAPQPSLTRGGPVSYGVAYSGASAVTLSSSQVQIVATGSAAGTASVSGAGTAERTITLSNITGNGTLRIALPAGTARDAAGNLAPSPGQLGEVTVDNTRPSVTITLGGRTPTGADTLTWAVVFSEPLAAALGVEHLAPSGTLAQDAEFSVSGSGVNYTVTAVLAAPDAEGTLGFTISEDVQDAAGNPLIEVAAPEYTVINAGPDISIGPPSAPLTRRGPVSYTVTYSGATDVTLTPGDIELIVLPPPDIVYPIPGTGAAKQMQPGLKRLDHIGNPDQATATGEISVSGSGLAQRTVTISNITGSGTVNFVIREGTARDAAGNPAPASAPSEAFVADNNPPHAVIALVDPQVTSADEVRFTVEFDQPVGDTFTVDDVIVTGSLAEGTTVSLSGGSPTPLYVVTLRPPPDVLFGDLGIAVGTEVFDAAGNAFAGAESPARYTIDRRPPIPTVSRAPGQPEVTSALPVRFVVTFSKPVVNFDSLGIEMLGTATGVEFSVTGVGATYAIEVSRITSEGTVIPQVLPSVATDLEGNQNEAFTGADHAVAFEACLVTSVRMMTPANGAIIALPENPPDIPLTLWADTDCAFDTARVELLLNNAPFAARSRAPYLTDINYITNLPLGTHRATARARSSVLPEEELPSSTSRFTLRQSDSGEDINRDGMPDRPFESLAGHGDMWFSYNVSGRTQNLRYVGITRFDGTENEEAQDDRAVVTLAGVDGCNRKVFIVVRRGLLNEGEIGLIMVLLGPDPETLLGNRGVPVRNAQPVQGLVGGGEYVIVTIAVSSDGGATYAPIDNSRLEANPVQVTLSCLEFEPRDAPSIYQYPLGLLQAPQGPEITVPLTNWQRLDQTVRAETQVSGMLSRLPAVVAPFRARFGIDVNGDGALDAIDIQLTINAALDLSVEGQPDVNGDGVVNAIDIQIVINAVLGLL